MFFFLLSSQPSTTSALPSDPNLSLDATYGLFPRPSGYNYFPSPADWRDINIYQLFTDRFADGDAANNTSQAMGINRSSWFVNNSGRSYPFNRNFHHGGDWKGLKDNLDYLTGMGVNAVWISGVQMNAQGRDTRYTPYHQYHPTDFFNVDPAQGTFQELKDLIDACHARGIYVILDVVINHTADLNGLPGNNANDDTRYWAPPGYGNFVWWDTNRKHPYPFNDLIHFHNNGTINGNNDGGWDRSPEYIYGQFKGTDDLKTESGHVTYWITEAFKNLIDATDCDGFRVDAIKHVEFDWVVKWADDIRQHAAFRGKSDFILFGEYFTYDNNTLASHVKDPGSFNSALFFPMSQTIKNVFIDGQGSGQLTGQLNNRSLYGEGANRLVTFIDNHDVNRISQQNGGDTGNDIWKLRPALSFLYLASPVPCLYYGTEHAFDQDGIPNGSKQFGGQYEGQDYDDQDWQRECMFDRGFKPGASGSTPRNKLTATNAPLYVHIKALNEARTKYRSLTRGSFTERWYSGGPGPYAFSRVYDQQEALVALNTADGTNSLTPAVSKPVGTQFVNVLNPSDKLTVTSATNLTISLSGKETKVYVAYPPLISTARRDNTFTFTYVPNLGPLSGATSIILYARSGSNGTVTQTNMTLGTDGGFTAAYTAPTGAETVQYWFSATIGGQTLFDNNNSPSNNYSLSTSTAFVMDGRLDSPSYEVASYSWMKLWAAVRGDRLYVATWGTGNNNLDHFIFLANDLGNATNAASAWNKNGLAFLNNHVYLAGEGENSYSAWSTSTGSPAHSNAKGDNTPNNYLEGSIDLKALNGGTMPEAIYIAAAGFATTNNGTIQMQAPAPWNSNEHLEVTEFLRLPIASIRDENIDGHFDVGSPRMWTLVGDNRQDANYGLRRFFLDETKGEQEWLTVELEPRTGKDDQITKIEVFTNLNRRDFARLPGEENRDDVTPTSLNTYYRAYTMAPYGNGRWRAVLPVNKCGAYRLQARWKFGTGPWIYYTDNGLRRDTAVVVSPRKSLDTTIYELNPLVAEATNTDFFGRSTFRNMYHSSSGRPGAISPTNLKNLGVNMIWLQPIHPIGSANRQTDPLTGSAYDPGSPYAVKNYWQVNAILGDPSTAGQAMTEFQGFVQAYQAQGIGIMLDGTFNHSAYDAEIGEMGVQLGLKAPGGANVSTNDPISSVRPGWYSRLGNYGEPATNSASVAVAPDRVDFGKWSDAADFFFGRYDALVQGPIPPALDTEPNRWQSGWVQRFLREDDRLEPLSDQTKELWRYFANYSLYWLDKTGRSTNQVVPVAQHTNGIAGLRCDFAQGLPSEFWEYKINRTRQFKWDFLFMAESLDGNREVDGNPRHGVGYRSARHFDILNESLVSTWRDEFFDYRANPGDTSAPNRSTGLLWSKFDSRKNAFEMSPILLNLTSHDEIFPTDDQWSLAYAYAITTAMDGVPMIFYGQEMGAQNHLATYGARTDSSDGIGANNNFAIYEEGNFGKSIPNFKRYNHMTNIWAPAGWKTSIRDTYARLNQARLSSPALRSQQNYFLADKNLGGWNTDIFAVAKVQAPGVSASQQDVVFVFVNNNFRANGARAASFNVNATNSSGANWFGIQTDRTYNVVDLASTNPAAALWGSNGITGGTLITNGIYVAFDTNRSFNGGQAQFLRLIDMTAGMTATSANNYRTNVVRLPAPVISLNPTNRILRLGQALNFTLAISNTATGLSAAANLEPANWSFNETGQFLFTPTSADVGTHTFQFSAFNQDGSDQKTMTVTVLSFENWAGSYGLLGTDADRTADPDNDSIPNWAEFHLGTNPTNPASRLKVEILPFSGGTNVSLRLTPSPSSDVVGSFYLQQADSLQGLTNSVSLPASSFDGQGNFSRPVSSGDLRTFFRVQYQPPSP